MDFPHDDLRIRDVLQNKFHDHARHDAASEGKSPGVAQDVDGGGVPDDVHVDPSGRRGVFCPNVQNGPTAFHQLLKAPVHTPHVEPHGGVTFLHPRWEFGHRDSFPFSRYKSS